MDRPRPLPSSLIDRLTAATSRTEEERAYAAYGARVNRTDRVRSRLIPLLLQRQLPLSKVVVLLHKAHMYHNEENVLATKRHEPMLAFLEQQRRQGIQVNSLAGLIRSADELPHDVSIGEFYLPSNEYVKPLLAALLTKVDVLFPSNQKNPVVHQQNAAEVLSAIQLAFLLIHPFADANGRVSEDFLYFLLGRRPDLQVHFLRPEARRKSPAVQERTGIILDETLPRIIQTIGKKAFHLPEETLTRITNSIELLDAVSQRELEKTGRIKSTARRSMRNHDLHYSQYLYKLGTSRFERILRRYYSSLSHEIYDLLSLVTPEQLENLSQREDIIEMADAFRRAPTVYTCANGIQITQMNSIT